VVPINVPISCLSPYGRICRETQQTVFNQSIYQYLLQALLTVYNCQGFSLIFLLIQALS